VTTRAVTILPLESIFRVAHQPLCPEGTLRRAGTHHGEAQERASDRPARVGSAPATGRNVVNPRVGNALQYAHPDREEQAGEVVQDHEVGTRMGSGIPIPKAAGHRATGRRLPGVDSLASKTTEGRSLDNPKRGSSDDRAE